MGHPRIRTPAAEAGAGRRVVAAACMALSGAALAATAQAEPGATAQAAAVVTTAVARCGNGDGRAAEELSCELAHGLGPLGTGAVVVAVTGPSADRVVSRGAELSTRFGAAIARALGPQARTLPYAEALAQMRGAGSGASLLVVAVAITGGEIRAVAEAHPAPRGFWDRVKGLKDEPGARASATRRLDGEIASFLPPARLAPSHIDKVAGVAPDIVALACGDVDGNGELEIAVVGRRKIQLGRVRGTHFVAHAEAPFSGLAPIAPSPLREPIAHAEIAAGRSLVVGSTDRESAVVLSGTLTRLGRLEGSVPFGPAGCLVRTGTLLGLPGPCERGAPTPSFDTGDLQTDAIASGLVVSGSGTARSVIAWRAPDGAVTLRDTAGHTARVASAGAALALADLDRDGLPDLVSSENTLIPAEDAVVVRSWAEDGTIRERFRVPVPDGIRALAACPTVDAGMASIVIATGAASLWVVR
ncbi:MAG TPA: hypothetical protein VF395_18950 [Polyangiaceae bacterium]